MQLPLLRAVTLVAVFFGAFGLRFIEGFGGGGPIDDLAGFAADGFAGHAFGLAFALRIVTN